MGTEVFARKRLPGPARALCCHRHALCLSLGRRGSQQPGAVSQGHAVGVSRLLCSKAEGGRGHGLKIKLRN